MTGAAAWVAKLQASVRNNQQQPFVHFTLTTLSVLDASPRARTVVMREVAEKGSISICTSTQSNKWAELQRDSRFELCLYFAETREQYRLRGNAVKMETSGEAVQRIWNKLSPAAKQAFDTEQAALHQNTFGVIQFTPNLLVELLDLFTGEKTTL